MLSRLARHLNRDPVAIREIAQRLTPAQRHGMSPLPDPLPIVPAVSALFEGRQLSPADRELIIAVAVSLDDTLAPVLEFDGRTAEEIGRSAVSADLSLRAGRIRLVDPRLGIWACATARPGVVEAVHERLGAVQASEQNRWRLDWHRARGSLHGQPSTAPELIRIARELSEAGDSDRALLLSVEAARHATGELRDEARLVAGASAIGGGFAREAATQLGGLFPDGGERQRLQGLAALLVAQSTMRGAVPDVDPGAFKPTSDDPQDWYAWTRAAALAAGLSAERGDRRRMRVWLDALREGSARVGAEQELRDPVVALSWLVVGDTEGDGVEGAGAVTGGMLRALRAAVDGDIDLGLHVLATHSSSIGPELDPFIAGFENSALVRAYRVVLEVLLLVWRGDIGSARDRMQLAAAALPVGLPFAGLGVVLARRLDLAVIGEVGPVSRALTDALPPAVRIDLLVDRSIRSYLAGAAEDAASTARLWSDLGSPQTTWAVPGIDEVLGSAHQKVPASHLVGPPEARVAQDLRRRLRSAADGRWSTVRDEVHARARGLRSPFERGRVEAVIGAQSAIRDDVRSASTHLLAAHSLFEVAGATAWATAVQERLSRLDHSSEQGTASNDALSACRRAWAHLLTSRELETAMRAVTGASNREIADALVVSIRTVEVHLGRVFSKLEVRTRVELTVLAHRTNRHT